MKPELLPDFLSVAEMSEGNVAAVWSRPALGFVLRSDLRPPQGNARPDAWLVPAEPDGKWERVILLKHPGLLDSFIRLGREPTEDRVLVFANSYGFLGEPDRLVDSSGGLIPGESLTDWRKQAGTVATLSQFWEWVDFQDTKALAPYVEWYTDPPGVAFKAVSVHGRPSAEMTTRMITGRPYRSVAPAVPDDAFYDAVVIAEEGDRALPAQLLRTFKRGDVIGPARQYLVWRTNRLLTNAGGVSRIVTPDGDIRYFPRTLLAAISVRLQDSISGRRLPERECLYWSGRKGRHFFKPTRRDRDFCSDSCRVMHARGGRK